MKLTSLVLSSVLAIAVPGKAQAIKPQEALALKPASIQVAAASNNPKEAAQKSQAEAQDPSTELQTLEKRFFMHDFSKETMEQRLQRMEKFTLGEVQKGTPEARVAHLSAVLETHSADTPLHSIAGVNPVPEAQSAPAQKAAADEDNSTDYPHITYLEDAILGKDFPSQPISTRLARLETKAFGAPSSDPDLSNRTDALERYAEVKLRVKPFVGNGVDQEDDGDFNMPAGRLPARSIVRNDEESMAPTPPPESARLLSRVAWCEMHTLGRTYPEMHLLPRLHQLNAKLFPNDKTKDIMLMDHVDQIVKEVVMRQHPATSQSGMTN